WRAQPAALATRSPGRDGAGEPHGGHPAAGGPDAGGRHVVRFVAAGPDRAGGPAGERRFGRRDSGWPCRAPGEARTMKTYLEDRVAAARRGLMQVQKSLIDVERIRYERTHGRIDGSGQLLQLVINDPAFEWV